MKITCSKKNCQNEALDGKKFCNYHQSKNENTKKLIMNIGGAVATLAIAIISRKSSNTDTDNVEEC
ncbi:hypothetical protein [Clostridium tarantellae]|uniref:Uncharacterized protein n=1 Tax=Clostridium tarantellae TaxID=39493 RepID=A0A6I1MJF7_9CLOT|nr:hypothetical protein [Clostridium tarantellae]MPQ42843.1 hypothetical protein [Clostridium tarantellae]